MPADECLLCGVPHLVSGCEHTRPSAFSFSLNDIEIDGAVYEPTTQTAVKALGHRVSGVWVTHVPTGATAACTIYDDRERNLEVALRRLHLTVKGRL